MQIQQNMTDTLYTKQEVAKHSTPEDCWVIIDNEVYDVTNFIKLHPGGQFVLTEWGGKDATKVFYGLHLKDVLDKYRPKLKIGKVGKPIRRQDDRRLSKVPYSEVSLAHGFASPYWKKDHLKFMEKARAWYYETIKPLEKSVERKGKIPKQLILDCGAKGIIPMVVGIYPWPTEYIPNPPFGVKPEQWDPWYEMAFYEGIGGVITETWFSQGFLSGYAIGLPPMLRLTHNETRDRVVRECMTGQKRSCLCITESFAGSDVAGGIQTVAKKTPCGKYYIVNGHKKWITSGWKSDYFTTAVRTGGKGMGGLSMLVVPRESGVKTTKMQVQTPGSETAYVEYKDCKVPVEYLVGQENKGFQIIMENFNHERWSMACQATRIMRSCVQGCFMWAHQRMAFGKPLIEQPVIRYKIAVIVSKSQACQALLEQVTYQMTKMSKARGAVMLAGPISLLKFRLSMDMEEIILESVQVMGGRGITKTGMGARLFNAQTMLKMITVTGGSAEIMADLGVRMAQRMYPRKARM